MSGSNSASKREMHKVFNDSVHGHMSIPSTCMEFVHTFEFERLRNIKQLGVANFVYPAANHNRFEHSLGTCYLAGKMAAALNANSDPEYKITDEEIECLQIAGLCHDLGHGPFSHLWERIVGGRFKHEDLSKKIFEKLANNIWEQKPNKDKLIDEVKNMMTGVQNKDGAKDGKLYLYQIVANKQNGIDVDKWDYFLRDGHQLNLGVTFDYRRILENCKIMEVEEDGKKVRQVCFRDKEAFNIYDMFRTRATLHRKAYQHPVVKCVETMLADAIKGYDKEKKDGKWTDISKNAVKGDDEKVTQYLKMTDNILHEVYHDQGSAEGSAEGIPKPKDIIDRIYKRKLYKRNIKRLYLEQGQKVKNLDVIKDELIKKLEGRKSAPDSLNKENFEVNMIDINLSSEKGDPFNNIKFYGKNGEQIKKKLEDVMMFSSKEPSTRYTVLQVLHKGDVDGDTENEVNNFMNQEESNFLEESKTKG